VKDALREFHAAEPVRFWELFLGGKPLAAERSEKEWFAAFRDAGLVRRKLLDVHAPCVRVFPLDGAMVATDLLSRRGEDQVFSLMLEQAYIVREMGVREGDRALELCVGSGVNSLFLSDVAERVVGVDVNRRALSFARFNAALNPGRVPLELRKGSLFEPVEETFDYVLVNPPFEPVPPGASHFLHSHGGEDGLDVVRALLKDLPEHLAPEGRFEMFTWSPGDDQRPRVADLVRDALPGFRVEVERVDGRPLDERIAQFSKVKGYAEWRDRLHARGYTDVWGVFLRAGPGPAETLVMERPDAIRAALSLCDEWS